MSIPDHLTVRPISVADIDAVAELDLLIFGRSAWSADAFAAELTESRISLLYLLQRSQQTASVSSPSTARGKTGAASALEADAESHSTVRGETPLSTVTGVPSPPALRGEMSRSDREGSEQFAGVPVTMGTLLGYFVCWTLPNQLHLANFAVHPQQQRRGFGGLLLQALFRLAQRLEVETIELEVRESNLAAQRLYHRHGFKAVGERPNFYDHPDETAILMDGPVPTQLDSILPASIARSYPGGLRLHWRDRAGTAREHWPATQIGAQD